MSLIPSLEIFQSAIDIFFGFFSGGITPGVVMILATFIIVMLMGRIDPDFAILIMIPLTFTIVATGFGLETWVFATLLTFAGMGLALNFFIRLLNK